MLLTCGTVAQPHGIFNCIDCLGVGHSGCDPAQVRSSEFLNIGVGTEVEHGISLPERRRVLCFPYRKEWNTLFKNNTGTTLYLFNLHIFWR